jgi:hypothetical protein
MKLLQEKIMKAEGSMREIVFDKYYLVPKDYTKVQWDAFMRGSDGKGFLRGFIGSPMWWTLLAASNYVQCMGNALTGKYKGFPWILGNMDLVLGAVILVIASYFRVKKMKEEEQQEKWK